MEKVVIAVDAMGGDFGPSVVVPGVLQAARADNITLILVGNKEAIEHELRRHNWSDLDVSIVHTTQSIEMQEKPSDILRRKKDASIQVACKLVKEGKAHGVISAGHSGATVACGMFILGRIPGVERPALASIMPTEKKPIVILDVGANVDCKPHHMFQFGLMGDAFAKDLLNIPAPRIGLLSIGEEEGKGNVQVKEAYELFKMAKNINFVGNAEGRDIFIGDVDVVVCDGFVGNVVLKLTEGLGSSLGRILKRHLLSDFLSKLGTLLARKSLGRFARFVDYAEYGGAPLLGLQAICVVCHGRSNIKSICTATKMAATFVHKGTTEKLARAICANEELTSYGKATKQDRP